MLVIFRSAKTRILHRGVGSVRPKDTVEVIRANWSNWAYPR